MSRTLREAAQMVLDALLIGYHRGTHDAIAALREALNAPEPEPVAEVFDTFGNSQDPNKAVGHVWLKAHYFPPKGAKLYAAPPAAPAVPDDEARLNAALMHVLSNKSEPAAPVVLPTGGVLGLVETHPSYVAGFKAGHAAGRKGSESAAPVVREPVIDEMDAIASKYAHKLALDLECVLLDYHGKWWNTAMQTLGEYRSAMNAIHERESPTHMGEPVIPARKGAE